MKKNVIAILLIAAMTLSACAVAGPSAEAPQTELQSKVKNEPELAPVKTKFNTEDFLEDYDWLWEQLEENYPFFSVLEERGINVEALRESNRDVLATRIKDLKGFMVLLKDTFRRMENQAHLSVWDSTDYERNFLVATPYPDHPYSQALLNPQTQATYALLASGDTSGTDGRSEPELPEVKTTYFPEVNAAYFYFKSFRYSLIERDQNVVVDYLSTLGEVDHIIFDVTGNRGGVIPYYQDIIIAPFGGEYSWEEYAYLKKTPLSERCFGQDYGIRPLSELPSGHEIPAFVPQLGMTHFWINQGTLPDKSYSGKTVKTQARRWVLTDAGSYSAADSFAAFCKSTGWATLVGQNTSGDGGFGMGPSTFALKNTGLIVRFSLTTSANSDGTMNSAMGTPPDIGCEKGETPLTACLRAITGE